MRRHTTREQLAADAERALAAQPPMTDVFTWRHVGYTIPVLGGREERRLLDDVSGFVAPGKLTALVGESGAGKVSGEGVWTCGADRVWFCRRRF